ncbi:carbohydrate porin [Nitrospira sp.]|nr:carbohydrate porin [Nitrospira sp.]
MVVTVQPVSAQDGTDHPRQQGAADQSEGAGCAFCDLWIRPTLTGDWGGYRSRLQELGVTFISNITQFGFGIRGGINAPVPPPLTQGDRFAYTGRGDYSLHFDLEKIVHLPKGKLVVTAEQWWGDYGNVSLSTGAGAPAVFGAALPPTPNNQGVPYLTNFFLVQPLSKNLVVVAGKKVVVGEMDQDRFAGGNGTQQFMNQALVANPAFLLGLPYSSFIAGVVSPQKWGRMAVSFRDPEDRTTDTVGLSNLYSKGVIVAGEVTLKTNLFGLPGDQHVGVIWKRFDQRNLNLLLSPPPEYPNIGGASSPTLSQGYTVFYGFDQFVMRYSDDEERGWGVFGRVSLSDGNPTPVRYFLSAGIGGDSPFKWNRGDTFGLGWYYTGASTEFGPVPQNLFGIRNGTGVELFYNFQATPWLIVTPDLQYIRPGAGAIADEAFLFGLRVNVKL